MASKLSLSTTVHMEEDWHLFGDASISGPIYQDELEKWSYKVDETVGDELTTRWMYPKSPVSVWAEPVENENELDTSVNPLPSPSEEQWLDFTSEYITNSDMYDVPDMSSWASSVPEANNCVINVQENVEYDVESSSCDVLADVVSLLLQRDDLPMLIEQVGTVDCSQLELLLTESSDIGNMMNRTLDARDVTEEQYNSSSECENDDDSDWSYSGRKVRRRSAGNGRQARSKPYRRQSKAVKFERKKEQNKNAATRYRERKRNEEHDNEVECDRLEMRNQELRARVQAMSHEVDVLRKLIVDIFRNESQSD